MRARALILTTLLIAAVQAQATLSRAIAFDDKVANAASIILGKCTEQRSYWDGAHKWILTASTFAVEKTMKGNPAQQMTIVTPGGAVDGIHQDTIGVPRFDVGEDQVLFVKNTQVGPTVLYFEQGAYEVMSVRGERMVKPAVSAAVLIDQQRGMAVSPEGPRSLREFENDVRESMRRTEIKQRMDMIEQQRRAREEASILNVLRHNKMLILLALIGVALATWQLVKRW